MLSVGSSRSTWLTPLSSVTVSAVRPSASISGLVLAQLAWLSESEQVSSTGVPGGTAAASARGSIRSASTTALMLPGFAIAFSPSGSVAGTVPCVRICCTAAFHAATVAGEPPAATRVVMMSR